jgi:hypothetical protein
MRKRCIRSIFALVPVLTSLSPIAMAQDAPPSNHGFNDVAFKNDYMTPRGLLVTNKGLTIQILNGFVTPLYQSASGPIDDVSLVVGGWNDLNPGNQNAPTWNEFDAFAGINFSIYKDWIAGLQYVAFISPPGNFNTEHNLEFSLRYEDKMRWLNPISLNPYAKLFFTFSGDSPVVLGKVPSFDVELGAVPTWDLHPYEAPVILTMPTWLTVGPADFWGGTSNLGVFSTGINARVPFEKIPPQYGQWSFNAGVQYYNLINGQLRNAQEVIGVVSPGSSGHRNVFVFAAGLGLHF